MRETPRKAGRGGWSYELLTLVAKRRTEMKEVQGWEVQRSICEAVMAVTAQPVRLDGLSSGGEATSNHLSFLLSCGFLTYLSGVLSVDCVQNPKFRGSHQINVHVQTLFSHQQ